MLKAPPFRADQVGSLLRPAKLAEARARRSRGEISDEALAAIEDESIEALVARQEAIGLAAVTDGELRRQSWLGDFFGGLEGTRTIMVPLGVVPKGSESDGPIKTIPMQAVSGKLGFTSHPMLAHFRFLMNATSAVPKLTIPAPSMLISAARNWRDVIDQNVYPDLDAFFEDLGETYRTAVNAFYEAGCRYLQFDDVNLGYLCDPTWRARIEQRGDDPAELLERWVSAVNTAIGGRPADLFVTTHICRGNFRSSWFAEGGYEPIAETLFNEFDYDGYFLEYDTDRAGGFEPLRFVPEGNKVVVLGLITTKTAQLESKDLVKRRIDSASRFVDVDRLCLSPQCGFASTEEGNLLTEDQEWRKLAHVVEIAREVWPDA